MFRLVATSASAQTARRLLTLVGRLLLLAGCLAVPSTAVGAGCHYSAPQNSLHPGGQPGRLASGAWWTISPVQCVYSGGKFTYYQFSATALPCDGPSCRGSTPEDSLTYTVTLDLQRLTLHGDPSQPSFAGLAPPAEMRRIDDLRPTSPVHSGPLRPPRA